jgi:hypothetical protein
LSLEHRAATGSHDRFVPVQLGLSTTLACESNDAAVISPQSTGAQSMSPNHTPTLDDVTSHTNGAFVGA